jgi:hypothetical protein
VEATGLHLINGLISDGIFLPKFESVNAKVSHNSRVHANRWHSCFYCVSFEGTYDHSLVPVYVMLENST